MRDWQKGILIAFCGIDGSGKTTQEDMLASWLTNRGIEVLQTKQPTDRYRKDPLVRGYMYGTGSEIGLEEMALMAAADRQFHLRTVIRPAVGQGQAVLCNRYIYSSYAFFVARGLELDFIKAINPKVETPDLTVLCDIPARTARERVSARDGQVIKMEEARLGFMEEVRQNFLRFADESFLILDARRPAEDCHAEVVGRVSTLLPATVGDAARAGARV